MSLPRFLRGLQKKPHTATLTPTTNDPNLSDSSSSSSSSGPKDAMGFPIPVSTVIMPTITSTITDRNNSVHNNSGDNNNRGQQQESSISSGPIDIITPHYHRLSATSTRSAASSAPSAASSFSTPSSIAVLTTTTTTSPSTGIQLTTTENRVRNNRSSRSSSVSSSAHSSSFRPPTVTVATNDDNDSNINKSGQLLSKSLPASSHLLSPFSSSTTTASPLPSTTILTSTMWTPMVNITSPSQSRPPQIIYPSAMIDSSVTSLLTATAPVSTTETSTEAVNKPTKTTMGFDIEVTYIEVQSDQDSNPGSGRSSGTSTPSERSSRSATTITTSTATVGGVDQLPAKKEQQFSGGEGVGGGPEAGGITGKTGRIRSNAIAQKQQLSHEKYSQEQPKTHTQESTSGVVDIEEPWPSSSRIHKGLDRDVTVATTTSTTTPAAAITTSAAVFQPGEGPRWSDSNFDLEHKAETLARDLVGAPVVQERAGRQPKQLNHYNHAGGTNSTSSSSNYKMAATTATTTTMTATRRVRSSSTPLITPEFLTGATPGTTSTSFSISSSSSSSAAGSGSHSPSRPVSILKNSHPPQQQRPKSILRTRSGSHPLLPLSSSTTTSSRPVSFISVSEPHSPQHSPISTTFPSSITSAVAARLSMTSDTSTVSHSSSFLFQDPMEQPSTPVLGATNISVPAKNASRKSSTSAGAGTGTQSHRRTPAPRDVDNTRSANSSPSSLPSELSRPRMPPNPSLTTQHMRTDHDEYNNNDTINNASKRRHTPQDTLDPSSPSSSATGVTPRIASTSPAHHRLSFPALNDYSPLDTDPSTATTTTTSAMATPLVATVPPENYTPLTLKSLRAAKSRSKLRQEPQIGVATGVVTGVRRNSLPRSSLLSTTPSSGGNEGSMMAAAAGLSSTPPSTPPVNHLPPLPTTPSPSNTLSDSPEMSSALLNASPGRRRATSPSILAPLHSLPTDPSLLPSSSSPASSSRRRESSTASTSGLVHIPLIMPRPILKDTSARDKMRESWMSEVPGIMISGTSTAGSSNRGSGVPYSQHSVAQGSGSPIAPPKSLARTNSAGAKRQSKMSRHSAAAAAAAAAAELDQDALTPRPRQGSAGYGPDYRPRRQSGGPGHLLFAFDASTSSADFESEEYEDSEIDDREELYSKHLQEQYTRLQKSQLRQSSMDNGNALTSTGPRSASNGGGDDDNTPYLAKRGQRKSLGDELDVPPVPEKSMQRKRVSTMGATTLPVMSTSLVSALSAANKSSSASETLSSIIRPNSTTTTVTAGHHKPKDHRGPYGGGAIGGGSLGGGSIGGNSLSFEPLFALKDSGSDSNRRGGAATGGGGHDSKLLLQGGALGSRLSEVSDADWYTALLTIDPNQQGVSIMDLSKRGLTEVPSGLPSTVTHLRLAYNTVQVLTPITSLTALHHLQVLDLCDNQLEILPPELGLLTRLKELYLSNNKLYKLPDTIQRMARLEVLDIRNNQFYLLNPVVGRLKALRQLDVRHNQLKSLPPLLYLLSPTLTLLLVDGNQFAQPFSDLLQPLMVDDMESQASTSARQSYLGDDPYSESGNGNSGRKMSTGAATVITAGAGGAYEPWRRSVAPSQVRRGNGGGVPVLAKRRSHGDLMSLMGLQRRDGNASTDDLLNSSILDYNKSNANLTSSGTYTAGAMGADTTPVAITKRERSVSTSNLIPMTEIHSHITLPSSSNSSSAHPLSLNKLFKSIRKSSKASMKENHHHNISSAALVSAKINDPKRYSYGSEADPSSAGEIEAEASHPQEQEAKPNSRGSNSNSQGVSRRATSGGINKWVKDRFHKRTNSNELGHLQTNNASMTSLHSNGGLLQDLLDGQPVRDSGYGVVGNGSTTPDLSSTKIIGSRHQNKSTGHLPSGSPFASRDGTHQLSSSFDPSQRKERDYRYSYMSMESQATQMTELESEAPDMDAVLHQQQQQHRLSSVHSPTTPLPSSPIMGLSANHPAGGQNNWNAATPRYGQSAAHIKPLMQYLKDLHDLDPDSSEWEEVYAWRRVWNSERAAPAGFGGSNANTPSQAKDADEDAALDEEQLQDQLAKSEEVRLAKLKAQASRRRRIVEEIMTTERTYVDGLKGLIEIYLTPALQVMPPGDHKAVFSNAQGIYTFHAEHFLPELEKAFKISSSSEAIAQNDNHLAQMMSPVSPVPTSTSQFLSDPSTTAPSSAASSSAALVPDNASKRASDVSAISSSSTQQDETNQESQQPSSDTTTAAAAAESAVKSVVEDRIGRVFAQHAAYMKMYSLYINNFDNALRVLQTQLTSSKHKKKMKEFLRRCAKHPNHTQLALQGYLLLPVQRIPRYKMLLQDLLENTWVDHVDYQDIASALEMISTRADEMNERKRQYENHEKVLLVQNRIIGQYKTPLVQPHRKVVREGMLHLIRVVTRNVSMMGLDNKSSSSVGTTFTAPLQPSVVVPPLVGDMTVHHLSEETVEKSFLFILFNDIMIQCNPVTFTGKNSMSGSGSLAGNMTALNGSSVTLGSSAGAGFSNGPSSGGAGGVHGGGSGESGSGSARNLELQRVLQLESRLHPAEVIGSDGDVLRVVDDAMVLYLTGDKDVIQAWKEDINSRW